jgi:hypothetical protein
LVRFVGKGLKTVVFFFRRLSYSDKEISESLPTLGERNKGRLEKLILRQSLRPSKFPLIHI